MDTKCSVCGNPGYVIDGDGYLCWAHKAEKQADHIAALEAESEQLRNAFDDLYFFAEQALNGVDFENRTVLGFLPLFILKQKLEQYEATADNK